MKLAAVLATCAITFVLPVPAAAAPGACPPFCDAIPDSAWMDSAAIPLASVYRWPGLAGLAVTASAPRFAFEDLCASPLVPDDARNYAVAERADVVNPKGQWQLQAQVVHWRGDTGWAGATAETVFEQAKQRLRACQRTVPTASPSLTTDDEDRIAAVISRTGDRVMHQYLLIHPSSSTIVELALWSALPPAVPWPTTSDAEVLDAMTAPLCNAYLGSCR